MLPACRTIYGVYSMCWQNACGGNKRTHRRRNEKDEKCSEQIKKSKQKNELRQMNAIDIQFTSAGVNVQRTSRIVSIELNFVLRCLAFVDVHRHFDDVRVTWQPAFYLPLYLSLYLSRYHYT